MRIMYITSSLFFCERRDELQEYLKKNGIQTLIHYPIPPHFQECYEKEAWNTPRKILPITEKIHRCELSIPMSQVVTTEAGKDNYKHVEHIQIIEAYEDLVVW